MQFGPSACSPPWWLVRVVKFIFDFLQTSFSQTDNSETLSVFTIETHENANILELQIFAMSEPI